MTDFFSNPAVWITVAVIVTAVLVLLGIAAWKFYALFLEILAEAFLGKHD